MLSRYGVVQTKMQQERSQQIAHHIQEHLQPILQVDSNEQQPSEFDAGIIMDGVASWALVITVLVQFALHDPADLWKPDLVLLDYNLRELDFSQKAWKDVLTEVEITQSDLSTDHKTPLFQGVATKGYLTMHKQP
ncbi:hypothetical protein DEU56DRAFT_761858 [Suillus clintonianus]|uniref:uncharacterized protein n=1 Tax=Suillus clintonianus TaxID=1904413 RepID=UPI001B886C7A|nr:uncharacterized protein DEU56DRAFT_761858 [Suillus clintonianus]KAG2114403.1 hypothetical protein DEU56DRAFT_761858 [Suillus clintonianus]